MAITRRALIITNPGEQNSENYCAGVFVDARRYKNLLLSACGGAWKEDEIVTVNRPTVATVKTELGRLGQVGYSFIMFSGHGCYSMPDNDRILELAQGQYIAATDLLANFTRRSMIIDCCQVKCNESIKIATNESYLSTFSARGRDPDPAACRELFMRLIEQQPRGYIRAFSCDIDEKASDDDKRGGRYSCAFLDSIESWVEIKKYQYSDENAVFSFVQAHQMAEASTIKISQGTQNPSIEKPRSGPYFPIAVFAT